MSYFFPVARIGITRIEHRAVVFAQIVHHAKESAAGRKTDLMARRKDFVERNLPMVVVNFDDWVLVRRILIELAESNGLEIILGIKNDRAAAEPDHRGCPAAAWMPNCTIGTTEVMGIVARNR